MKHHLPKIEDIHASLRRNDTARRSQTFSLSHAMSEP
jgi:hypothetical protein